MRYPFGMLTRAWLAGVCAAMALGAGAAPAQGAASDPLFVFFGPTSLQLKPSGFDGPCGIAVNTSSNIYISDYYRHAIDVFNTTPGYLTQMANEDPLDGPCGLALDPGGRLYVNNFHRNVVRFPSFSLGSGVVIDSEHPTGVAVDPVTGRVYVDDRTFVAVYDSTTGAPVLDGEGHPLKIGVGDLVDGYGVAAVGGRVYVPDAGGDTVKIFEPSVDANDPVATIAGLGSGFISLRDSAIAVDRTSGKIYVVDNIQPQLAEEPEAIVDVFSAAGAFLGRLKYGIVDAVPPGLAVDNTLGPLQGRVYVTSGNTTQASLYGYGPNAETSSGLPATFSLAVETSGAGKGSISSAPALGVDCATACAEQIRAGAEVTLTATPSAESAFSGWSGGGCSGSGACTVTMDEATSVHANFERLAGPPVAAASTTVQRGTLRVDVSGRLSPHKLPREGLAPISVSVGWKIATTDESAPPKLTKLQIEINRHGRFDFTGLPACPVGRIQPASTSRALANCRSALVGEGNFTAEIGLEGQEPYAATGRLLVFNGLSHGKPVLLGQIYAAHPFATSFVIVFKVKQLEQGTYGTALVASLPKALLSWGDLTGIEMKLARRYGYQGQRHSFISAGCPAPKGFPGAVFPLARTAFAFSGGTSLTSTLTDECKVRG